MLFALDLTFLVTALIIGIVINLLDLFTGGYVSSDWYDEFVNMSFQAVFGMSTNDIEAFRKARAITQLFFETVWQIVLQIRILYWI